MQKYVQWRMMTFTFEKIQMPFQGARVYAKRGKAAWEPTQEDKEHEAISLSIPLRAFVVGSAARS